MPTGGLRSTIFLFILALAALVAWTTYYIVPSDSVAVVQRFGKYLKDVPSGLHFKLPLGIDVATIVPDKRQLKQEFGFATAGATDPSAAKLGQPRRLSARKSMWRLTPENTGEPVAVPTETKG